MNETRLQASKDIKLDWVDDPRPPELPRRRYLDEAFYQLELEHVFRKSWLKVGHVSEFGGAGSYRLLDVPFAPVFVVRGKDGTMRAFLNSCQHRGAAVLKDSAGCAKALACQYHGWTYDLNGKLLSITSPENFSGLDIDNYALPQVRCELWGGFIFINFDNSAEPLHTRISPLVARFSYAAEAPVRVIEKRSWVVECNWKAQFDNFLESYHVNYIHPRTAALLLDTDKSFIEIYRNGTGTNYNPYLPPDHLQWEGAVQKTPLPTIPGMDKEAHKRMGHSVCIFPNVLTAFGGAVFYEFQVWPLGVSQCRLDVVQYGTDWGTEEKPSLWEKLFAETVKVAIEDFSCMAAIQKSMAAAPDKGIPLGAMEGLIYNVNVEIDRCIGRSNMDESLRVKDTLALRHLKTGEVK